MQTSTDYRAFQNEVIRSAPLQAKVRSASSVADLITIAGTCGYNLGPDDFANMSAAIGPAEPSDAELESIAGAAPCWCDPSVVNSKSCSAN